MTSLLASQMASIRATRYAQQLTAIAFLAEYQLIETEYVMRKEGGWVLEDKIYEGNFAAQGWPDIKYKCVVDFLEIPDYSKLRAAKDDSDRAKQGESSLYYKNAGDKAFGALAMVWPMVKQAIERSIRKVKCTVFWKDGKHRQRVHDLHLLGRPREAQDDAGPRRRGQGGRRRGPQEGGDKPGGGKPQGAQGAGGRPAGARARPATTTGAAHAARAAWARWEAWANDPTASRDRGLTMIEILIALVDHDDDDRVGVGELRGTTTRHEPRRAAPGPLLDDPQRAEPHVARDVDGVPLSFNRPADEEPPLHAVRRAATQFNSDSVTFSAVLPPAHAQGRQRERSVGDPVLPRARPEGRHAHPPLPPRGPRLRRHSPSA
jgi:hypothetical protein